MLKKTQIFQIFNFQLRQQFGAKIQAVQPKLSDSKEYLLDKLKKERLQFISTKDKYRIDVGILVERLPIFLKYDLKHIENERYRYNFIKKYNLCPETPNELKAFDRIDKNEEFEKTNTDNIPSHAYQVDGKQIQYSEKSQLYYNTDPATEDQHSIQTHPTKNVYLMVKQNNSWVFPSRPLLEKENFSESKEELVKQLTQGNFTVWESSKAPILCHSRELSEQEKAEPKNKKMIGVKCFYYSAIHLRGSISMLNEQYQDYALVPRFKLNKFINQIDYEQFVHSMKI